MSYDLRRLAIPTGGPANIKKDEEIVFRVGSVVYLKKSVE